jgi:hypothetical protein
MRKALLAALLFGAAYRSAADEQATAIADEMMRALEERRTGRRASSASPSSARAAA